MKNAIDYIYIYLYIATYHKIHQLIYTNSLTSEDFKKPSLSMYHSLTDQGTVLHAQILGITNIGKHLSLSIRCLSSTMDWVHVYTYNKVHK